MFYQTNRELPSDLRTELSEAAQNLYRETFNQNYPKNHNNVHYDSEELAHEAAWRAVRSNFELKDGMWQ
jgi:cation transport regulator ChaB